MAIQLHDLTIFCAVAERGSFSAAAVALHVSQSLVSQRMALLESHVGAPLFTRQRRGVKLSDAGEHYLTCARSALDLLQEGRQQLRQQAARPVFRVGAPPSIASSVFTPLVTAVSEHPLTLFCQTEHSVELMERLLSDRLHVAFVVNRPSLPGLSQTLLCRSPIIAACHPSHPLMQRARHLGRPLRLDELAGHRFAPQWWGSDTQDLADRLTPHVGASGSLHLCQPADTARRLALVHQFVAFAPELGLRAGLESGQLVKLPLSDLPAYDWRLTLAYRPQKRQDPLRERVLEAAVRCGRALGPAVPDGAPLEA